MKDGKVPKLKELYIQNNNIADKNKEKLRNQWDKTDLRAGGILDM